MFQSATVCGFLAGSHVAAFLYVLKLGAGQALDRVDFSSQIITGECPVGVLEHAEQLASLVFAPLIAAMRSDWSE